VTEKKKKEKAPATAEASASTATSGAVKTVKEAGKKVNEAAESKKARPPKADGGKKEKATATSAPAKEAEGSGEPVPSMIDLRVGHIVHSASYSFPRPDLGVKVEADWFLQSRSTLMRMDCTSNRSTWANPRARGQSSVGWSTIFPLKRCGTSIWSLWCVVPFHFSGDARVLMTVCIKCNLKPANMRGVKSHAMVLCVRRSPVVSIIIITPELDTIYRQHLQPVRREGLNSSNHHQARNPARGFTSRARSMKVCTSPYPTSP